MIAGGETVVAHNKEPEVELSEDIRTDIHSGDKGILEIAADDFNYVVNCKHVKNWPQIMNCLTTRWLWIPSYEIKNKACHPHSSAVGAVCPRLQNKQCVVSGSFSHLLSDVTVATKSEERYFTCIWKKWFGSFQWCYTLNLSFGYPDRMKIRKVAKYSQQHGIKAGEGSQQLGGDTASNSSCLGDNKHRDEKSMTSSGPHNLVLSLYKAAFPFRTDINPEQCQETPGKCDKYLKFTKPWNPSVCFSVGFFSRRTISRQQIHFWTWMFSFVLGRGCSWIPLCTVNYESEDCALHKTPPRWPSGKASASRAKDPGFESRLHRDFFGVKSYQWLKNWHSSGYPARRLAL